MSSTESNAILVIKQEISRYDNIDGDGISVGDKEISYDGYIRCFSSPDMKVDCLAYDVPVQVKGRTFENSNNLEKNTINFPVRIKDLINYYKMNGVLYFVVFVKKPLEESVIYYSLIYPTNAKIYLDSVKSKNKDARCVRVRFIKLNKNTGQLQKILNQFNYESTHQGSGSGQIVHNAVYEPNIKTLDNISFTSYLGRDDRVILDSIIDRSICLYSTKNDIDFPVIFSNIESVAISNRKKGKVQTNNKLYYESYKVITSTEHDKQKEIRLSDNLSLFFPESINDGQNITFQFFKKTSLKQLSIDAEFLLNIFDSNMFTINGEEIGFKEKSIPNDFRPSLKQILMINEIMNEIKYEYTKPFCDLTEKDYSEINTLFRLREGKFDNYNSNENQIVLWRVEDRKIPLIIEHHGNKNELKNLYYVQGIIRLNETSNYYRIPNFILTDILTFSELNYYDMNQIENQLELFELNEFTADYINDAGLYLIAAFDKWRIMDLLLQSKKIFIELMNKYPCNVLYELNYYQIKYRENIMKEDDDKRLFAIINDEASNKEICFACYVLLHEKEKAQAYFMKLEKDKCEEIKKYPIYNLFTKLTNE